MKRVIHFEIEQPGHNSGLYMAEYIEPNNNRQQILYNELCPKDLKGYKIVDAYYGEKQAHEIIIEVE